MSDESHSYDPHDHDHAGHAHKGHNHGHGDHGRTHGVIHIDPVEEAGETYHHVSEHSH
ncbi:MAG: hypothetical protein O2965_01575 [Bacteroidetes bacterium]|nr:hypothetical protein [Bacteroidota bacterium]